jgi:hypothetical protein
MYTIYINEAVEHKSVSYGSLVYDKTKRNKSFQTPTYGRDGNFQNSVEMKWIGMYPMAGFCDD